VDWPAHLHKVEIAGRDVNYVDIGEGDSTPVVFVHGLGGQWQNFLENIPRTAQQRRVLALDLPGFGCSAMPADDISITGYGRCVNAFLDEVGVERAHLVGNSMGGFVTAEVAIQFPQRVDRLVLISAAGISTASADRDRVLAFGRALAASGANEAAQLKGLARRPLSRALAFGFVARYPARMKADLVYEGFLLGTGKPGFYDALRATLDYDYRDRIGEIRVPTLIVWGEKDMIVPVRDAQQYERLIDDARKVTMAETGHVPMAERPEAFNELLLEFVAETAPAEDKEPFEGATEVR
jgi:pimeloyl-ACP methyl ester carboxylesterase